MSNGISVSEDLSIAAVAVLSVVAGAASLLAVVATTSLVFEAAAVS